MALQLAVLQVDQGRSRSRGRESNLDFTRLGRVRVALPIRLIVSRTNMPRETDPMRRVPRQHRAPVIQVAFDVSLIPPPPDSRLHEDRFEGSLSNVMGCRPPRLHSFYEHAECALDRRLYAYTLTYDCFFHSACQVSSLLSGISRRRL